jgi:hypothetical protein
MLEQIESAVVAPEGAVKIEDSEVYSEPTTAGDNSLDKILEAALDKAEGKAPADSAPTKEKSRDEKGRFIQAEAKPSETSEPAVAEANPAEEQPKTEEAKPASQTLDPHPRWTEAEKAVFAKLDPEAQAWVLNREKDAEGIVTRKTQEIAEQRKAHEPLLNAVGEWSQYLNHLNVTPDAAFREMMAVERVLRYGQPHEKQAALANLAQTFEIPIHSGDGVGDMPAPDPRFTQQAQEIHSLKRELQEMRKATQENERQRAEYEFNALALTKDANGSPKFPHFDRVKTDMIRLVANGQADTWDAAYEKSVRLNDDLYKSIVESERKKALEADEAARKSALDKAKNAKRVSETSSIPNGRSSLKGIDSHIEAALDKVGIS